MVPQKGKAGQKRKQWWNTERNKSICWRKLCDRC